MKRSGVHTIKIEPMTASAFAPYGEVIAASDKPKIKELPYTDEWSMSFEVDGTVEPLFVRFKFLPWRFQVMERHSNQTQCHFPLGGKPIIMVVARATNPTDWEAVPAPEDIRAFVTDGMQGTLMWRGTWHAVYRFPVYPPHVDIICLTTRETTADQLDAGDGSGGEFVGVTPKKFTQRVDYKQRFGVTFDLSW